MTRVRYMVVIENAGGNLSAYVPDLPGCVATGGTIQEVVKNIQEAIEFHLEGLRDDGIDPPLPCARTAEVEAVVPNG